MFANYSLIPCGISWLIISCYVFSLLQWSSICSVPFLLRPKKKCYFFLLFYFNEKQNILKLIDEYFQLKNTFKYDLVCRYVLVRYVEVLLGRCHLREGSFEGEPPSRRLHLTPQELHGIKAIVTYLHSLPTHKKAIPDLIVDPVSLIKDVRTLVQDHRHDLPEYAITGYPVLSNPTFKYGERKALLAKGLNYPGTKVKQRIISKVRIVI